MAVITTLKERREEKQILFERKVIKELSLKQLRLQVKDFFSHFFYTDTIFTTAIEDGCIDIAIETYLLGAHMSRFGYFGESASVVRQRCRVEEKDFIDSLYEHLQYWGAGGGNDLEMESLHMACENYIDHWWLEGFRKGEMRHKLRLH